MIRHTRYILAGAICFLNACALNASGANVEDVSTVAEQVCTRLKLGMSRDEVDSALGGLPVTFRFSSRESLVLSEPQVYGNVPTGGMYLIDTKAQFRWATCFKREQAFFSVLFDESGRVMKIDVRTFTLPTMVCPP
jgi:hypothetical protein